MSSLLTILAASEPTPPATTSVYSPRVRVEIAFNAGYLTAASLRTWTDVSDYVNFEETITISGGRGDERSTADANHLNLTLDNSDGRFTFGKTSGPYGAGVKLGRPIRVIADPVDGSEMVEFLGFIDELPTEWNNGTDASAQVSLSATSRLARLGLVAQLTNVVSQAILADSPAGYYTLGEPADSTQANDSSGRGAAPLELAGDPTNPVEFGTATGPETDGLTAATFAGSQYLATPQFFDNASAYTLEAFFSAPAAPSSGAALIAYLAETDLALYVSTAGKLVASVRISPASVSTVTSSADVIGGATHHAATKYDGTTLTLYLDGAVIGTAASGPLFINPGTLAVGGGYIDIGAGGGKVASPLTGVVAHAAVWTSLLSDAQVAAHATAGLTGFAGETTSVRLARYLGYVGVESAALNAETGQVTVQHVDTTDKQVVELMRIMETTEGGILYDERDGVTTFHNRAHRLTAASIFTLDMALQQVETGYAPKADRSAVANDVTASDVSGQFTAHAFDATSKTDNGVATMSIETAAQDDDEPLFQASWALYKYKSIRERVPSLTVYAPAQVGKTPNCAAVMAAKVGDKITVNNRPSQAATSSVDYFIEGWTKVYGLESLFITWNLSPSSPDDQTLVIGDASRGVIGTNPVAL